MKDNPMTVTNNATFALGKRVFRSTTVFSKTTSNMPIIITGLTLLVSVLVTPVTSAQSSNLPEEIIVNAPESLRNLRLEINRAQENMFNVFNVLNEDDRFDVHCEYVRRWQSKIREQVCSPAYLKHAQEEEAEMLLGQFGFVGATRGAPGVTQMDYFNEQFAERMKTLFKAHPEFRQAMGEYNALTETLEETRKQRLEK